MNMQSYVILIYERIHRINVISWKIMIMKEIIINRYK